MVLGLEAMLFILLGLQAPQLAEQIDVAPLVGQAVVVGLAVVAVRMAFALVPQAGFGDTWRERVAVGWAGMRGAISLAAALSIPLGVQERPEILLITFGVIFITLVGQGLTLAPLLRKLDLRGEERWSPDEATARLETAQAALDRLEELEDEGAGGEPVRRLRELYRGRFALCVAVLGGGELPEDGRRELKEYGAMRRELIVAERAALIGLRNDGPGPQRPRAQDRARPRPGRGADPSAVGSRGDDRGTDAGRVGLRPRDHLRARRPRARHVVSRSAAGDRAARRTPAPRARTRARTTSRR